MYASATRIFHTIPIDFRVETIKNLAQREGVPLIMSSLLL